MDKTAGTTAAPGVHEKEARPESFNATSSSYVDNVKDHAAMKPSDLVAKERRALEGYDTHGGASSSKPISMKDHLGVRPASDTLTSGSVSGEAWDRCDRSGMSEAELERKNVSAHGGQADFAHHKPTEMQKHMGDKESTIQSFDDTSARESHPKSGGKDLRYVPGALARSQ